MTITATEIIADLWQEVQGTSHVGSNPDFESGLKPYRTKLFRSAWERWANRNEVIMDRVHDYTRNRDFHRALRHNDLCLAADLDRIAAKKK